MIPVIKKYIHGYSDKEAKRLNDQANALNTLLHHDTIFKKGSLVLEAGCGNGAQTRIIADKNPESRFISLDLSIDSLIRARACIQTLNLGNVHFQRTDIFNLPFKQETFDYVFICFVLEHLAHPLKALIAFKRVLKKNGKIMVIEGDHGSTYFYPDSKEAHLAIQCLVQLQSADGGDANIGRSLYPMLAAAGFKCIEISPRMVYVDDSKPELVEGFTRNTFSAMVEGIREKALREKIIDPETFDKGIRDLYHIAEGNGVFCYTFFKGFASK
jgi:SAM-dependent methyltransferase